MLFLDLDGIQLYFNIRKFREDAPGESEHDNWCYMDLSVTRGGVSIYHECKNSPWLTCDEIKEIRDAIKGVLSGTITQNKRLGFIESDIELEFQFNDDKFSYAELSLYYWETEGRACLTANKLVLCLDLYELERILCELEYATGANYDKSALEKYCLEGTIKKQPDVLSFKLIDGDIAPGEFPKSKGVVGIFVNDREMLDIVAEIENAKWENGAMDYIHQMADELVSNLIPKRDLEEWQEENGTEILSCTCGIIEDGSPTVFIEKDDNYVYWKALGHNQIPKKNYCFPLTYIFDRRQYDEALETLKEFAKDKDVY